MPGPSFRVFTLTSSFFFLPFDRCWAWVVWLFSCVGVGVLPNEWAFLRRDPVDERLRFGPGRAGDNVRIAWCGVRQGAARRRFVRIP